MPTAATLTDQLAKAPIYAALSEIDAEMQRGLRQAADRRASLTQAERDAAFRAYHLGRARDLIDTARNNRQWIKDVDALNPVGPSMARLYGETHPQRARRLAEIARHRRLAMWGTL